MLETIIARSRALKPVSNFFSGKRLPDGFGVPSDILLYCHNVDWPHTIISSRYMLIFPFVDLTYEVEDRQYPLTCGQAILVKPYLHRSVPPLHQDYLRLIVSFELSGEQDYLPQEPVMTVTPAAWAQVEALLEHYNHDEIMPASFALTLLLGELSRNVVKTVFQPTSEKINHATNLINQYIGESFGIKDIAAKVGLSASHLRRRFRQEIGMSLGQYIDRRRLSAAQRLLADTDLRVEAVAASCGYDSIYAFSRFFKKNTGIPPLRFRQQQRDRQEKFKAKF